MKTLLLGLLLLSTPALVLTEARAAASTSRKGLSADEKKELEALLTKNDLLFNALLKKDGMLIQKTAKELASLVEAAKAPLLKEVKAAGKELSTMSAYNDQAMTSYEKFLNPLVKLVKEYNTNPKFNLFYCPMVQKSWIQDTTVNKDVRNVYAMEMLECGDQTTQFK